MNDNDDGPVLLESMTVESDTPLAPCRKVKGTVGGLWSLGGLGLDLEVRNF